MIRINQLKIPYEKSKDEQGILLNKIAKKLNIPKTDISSLSIVRKSIDGREKPNIYFVYSVDVTLENENKLKAKAFGKDVSKVSKTSYRFKPSKTLEEIGKTVVVGMGPAGLFCGYFLAINGYKPLIIERGKKVEDRLADVEKFWETGIFNTESNVQFGEGGAGTFSDGKLNTMVKDKLGRNKLVLETFVKFGANPEITYVNKPHIGTDVLSQVISNMRQAIIDAGGEIRFETKLTDIVVKEDKIAEIIVNDNEHISVDNLVLALGHSARDTFKMLYDKKLHMEPKAFAVGVRMEHKQALIDEAMYGMKHEDSVDNLLGAADYKLTAHASNGRSVYSFCMCPGGYVVNASSEEGMLAVNGMSYSKRDSENANSAIIVSVTPEDFKYDNPLSGIEFQRELEKNAFYAGNGKIPVQTYGDFKLDRKSAQFGAITPVTKGNTAFADINQVLPKSLCDALKECIPTFGKTIKGFDDEDALMLGVESRTSSPLRIVRDNELNANIKGIYPCGEGAGYAGGITSAAMDGIRVFEAITSDFNAINL